MVAQPHQTLISVEEYFALDRSSNDVRYEYIDGYAIMMADGTLNHSAISINLTSLLRTQLRGSACRVYNSDARVRLTETCYVFPDASVSCSAEDRGTTDIVAFPRVVFEVLSPSTEAFDRGKKFIYYRSCPTIEAYVLIDTQQQAVDVYRRATENLWTLHIFGPDDIIELANLNIRIPLAYLYENVPLPENGSDNPEFPA